MKHQPAKRGLTVVCLLALAAVILGACSDEPSQSSRPSQRERAAPQPDPAPAPVLVEDSEIFEEERPPEYVYSPIGKRDPFRSPFQDLVAMERESGPQERLTALQRWEIDQLHLRAIISATADPMAMVVDPEGHGHVVRRGVLMGRNWGRVTAIRRECLVITEQMRDASGTPMAVQQERCLPKDDREVRFEEQMRRQVQ